MDDKNNNPNINNDISYLSDDEELKKVIASPTAKIKEEAELSGKITGEIGGRAAGMEEGMRIGIEQGFQEGYLEGLKKGREEGYQSGKQEGIIEGEIKGRKEGRMDIIKKLLLYGMEPDEIASITHFPLQEIEKLQEEIK